MNRMIMIEPISLAESKVFGAELYNYINFINEIDVSLSTATSIMVTYSVLAIFKKYCVSAWKYFLSRFVLSVNLVSEVLHVCCVQEMLIEKRHCGCQMSSIYFEV